MHLRSKKIAPFENWKDKTSLYFVRGGVSLLYGLRDSINPAAVSEFRVAAILQLTIECNKSIFNEYSWPWVKPYWWNISNLIELFGHFRHFRSVRSLTSNTFNSFYECFREIDNKLYIFRFSTKNDFTKVTQNLKLSKKISKSKRRNLGHYFICLIYCFACPWLLFIEVWHHTC